MLAPWIVAVRGDSRAPGRPVAQGEFRHAERARQTLYFRRLKNYPVTRAFRPWRRYRPSCPKRRHGRPSALRLRLEEDAHAAEIRLLFANRVNVTNGKSLCASHSLKARVRVIPAKAGIQNLFLRCPSPFFARRKVCESRRGSWKETNLRAQNIEGPENVPQARRPRCDWVCMNLSRKGFAGLTGPHERSMKHVARWAGVRP